MRCPSGDIKKKKKSDGCMSLTFRAGNTHFGFINLKLYEDCLGHLGGDFITALSNGNKM